MTPGATVWQAEAVKFLMTRQFAAAVQVLKAVPLEERPVSWYALASFLWHAAGEEAGVEKADTARELVILIDAGIRHNPESSRLLLLKVYQQIRTDEDEGRSVLAAARQLAKRNLASCSDESAVAERKVLEDIAGIEADLQARRVRRSENQAP